MPTNGQLYFIDSEEANDIRNEMHKDCKPEIMEYINDYISEYNKYAQSYKLMKDVYQHEE